MVGDLALPSAPPSLALVQSERGMHSAAQAQTVTDLSRGQRLSGTHIGVVPALPAVSAGPVSSRRGSVARSSGTDTALVLPAVSPPRVVPPPPQPSSSSASSLPPNFPLPSVVESELSPRGRSYYRAVVKAARVLEERRQEEAALRRSVVALQAAERASRMELAMASVLQRWDEGLLFKAANSEGAALQRQTEAFRCEGGPYAVRLANLCTNTACMSFARVFVCLPS
jgi:hypothetical protein